MRRCPAAVAVLASGVLVGSGLVGCASSAPDPPASTPSAAPTVPAVPGIEAEAVRLRTDEATGGRFQVRVTDTGEESFTVTAVALDSPGFGPLPETPVVAEFAPGRVIDLPTPYGAVDCTAAVAPVAARLTVVRPDGAVEQLRVPLAGAVLAQVHAEECAVRSVLEVVDIAVTDLREDGDALAGDLRLTRTSGDDPIAADRIDRSVLIGVTAAGLPVVLGRDDREVSTPVSFTPASCDPHVLAETKQPYVFPLTVRVGDAGEPIPVDLPLDQATRDQLAALVDRVCELPG